MLDDQVISIREVIFWLTGAFALGVLRILSWIMPQTGRIFYHHIKNLFIKDALLEIRILSQKVDNLSTELSEYKRRHHATEGELKQCKKALIDEDQEVLKILKDHYKNEENSKNIND